MPNIFTDNNLHYHYNTNIDNSINTPNVYVLNRKLETIGQIEDVNDLAIICSLNEPNEISFTTHKYINGNKAALWDKIKDCAVIKVEGFGIFEIDVPDKETDIIIKEVHGQDLFSCELGQSNCTLEINTENDYTPSSPTLFYNPDNEEASLLHRILSYAPNYKIGHVDDSLKNMNRELSCSDKPIYDFLMSDVSEQFGCIFIFDNFSRVINVYDLKDHCLNCGSHHIIDGECQICKKNGKDFTNIESGFGQDTSVYIDTENLATEMTITGDKDSLKNCFKLQAGDDEMTEMIGQRLIGGTNYLWDFSSDTLNDMSDELREKYIKYVEKVENSQDTFNELWDTYNECLNQISYYKDNMFPETTTDVDSAEKALNLIISIITYGCISSKSTVLSTVSKNILNYAKLILPEDYDVKFEKDSNGNDRTSCTTIADGNYDIINTWTGYLYVYRCNYTDDNGNDLDYCTSGAWTLEVKKGYDNTLDENGNYSNEYFLYLKRQLDYALAKSETTYKAKYDDDYDDVTSHLSDYDYYKNYFWKFNVTTLQSYLDAYNACSVVINQINSNIADAKYVKDDGTISDINILNKLLNKYVAFSKYISEEVIPQYQKKIDDYTSKAEYTISEINKINASCNMKDYLGDELYTELISFKREDVYSNDNFTSDMSDNDKDLLEDIDEFILSAKEELEKASRLSYSCTTTINNLLLDKEFNYGSTYEYFALGNYIRLSIDETPVKVRITQLTFNFNDDIEQLPISLSDAIVSQSSSKNYQDVINSTKSMATSFNYLSKQTEANDSTLTSVVGKLIDEGLAAVNDMVLNVKNIVTTIDDYGILGRKWNEDTNSFDSNQYRLIHNDLVFTHNNWQTSDTAVGNIYYNGEWRYGISTQYLIGKVIIGESLLIENKSGSVKITGDGINVTSGYLYMEDSGCSIEIDPQRIYNTSNDKLISAKVNDSDVFYVTRDGKGFFKGTIAGGNININNKFIVDSNGNVTLPSGTKLSWSDVTGTDDIATKNYVTSQGYETATSIKNTVITKDYIETLNIKAGSVAAENITGTTISGKTITGGTIKQDNGYYSIMLNDGYLKVGNVQIFNGLLNYNGDKCTYTNAFNIACDGYSAEVGFRWHDNTVNLIGKPECPFNLGESSLPIHDIYANGTVSCNNVNANGTVSCNNVNANGTVSCNNVNANGFKIGIVTDYMYKLYFDNSYPYITYYQYSNSFNLYPSVDNTSYCGISENRWSNIWSYAFSGASDRKLKTDINDIDVEWAENFIDNLKPSTYKFKDNTYGKTHTGFIAQDVEEVMLNLGMKRTDFAGLVKTRKKNATLEMQEPINIVDVMYDPDNFDCDDENYDYALRYDDFIAPLVSYCQNLKKRNIELENKYNSLEQKINKILQSNN